MFKGFYNLTSGMITQGRMLDVISNNMTNVSTPGYKVDRLTISTFEQVLWNRVGNRDRRYSELGDQSWITMPSQLYTDYAQGTFDQTDLKLDFAIQGNGYFAVRKEVPVEPEEGAEEGEEAEEGGGAQPQTEEVTVYTRNGNFALDSDGYLSLPGQGRVLSAFGEPLQISTDSLDVDAFGRFYASNGAYLGRVGVFAFEDDAQLEKDNSGVFTSEAEPEAVDATVMQGWLERSNVDWVREMAQMMSAQRAYQSAAEVVKIYDEVMNKAVTDVGRMA